MTGDDLALMRKGLSLTQVEFAELLGLSPRAYQGLERGEAEVRKLHVLAAERVALSLAAERSNPMLAPASARREALRIAETILRG